MQGEQPVGAGCLHKHHNRNGDSGKPRTVAQAEKSAEDKGAQCCKDEVPRECSEERKREAKGGANDRAEDAIARGGDGGAEVGLENDDGADGSPVAVMQAEAQCNPPAEGGSDGGFG